MKILGCLLFFGLIFMSCSSVPGNKYSENYTADEIKFIERQINLMDNIITLHKEIKNIHPSLEKLYSISVANNGYLYVFDLNDSGHQYEIIRKEETWLTNDDAILASFPLSDGNPSAIISKDVLENPENYVFIFHEFVHCFQWYHGEMNMRQRLSIEQQELEKNNYNWEINYPFPYEDMHVIEKIISLNKYFAEEDYDNILKFHDEMKTYLSKTDFEYMAWQEWKEGFARYIENLIRRNLELEKNNKLLSVPLNRVSFYDMGSNYIELIVERDNNLNIAELFQKIMNE